MKLRLIRIWDQLRTNYWFMPAVLSLAATALAFVSIEADRAVKGTQVERWWAYQGGADGARSVLSTIAGSMITVAGLVFSITIVALTLASSQFGPRLLRNFMRDTTNQVVLGTFVATFLYCLLVLRTVRGGESNSFVPHISVAIGVLLAVASLIVLIYFIHHIAVSIQANRVVTSVSSDLLASIDSMFPERSEDEGRKKNAAITEELSSKRFIEQGGSVVANRTGYLQILDYDSLVALACEHDIILEIYYRPGHFIVQGSLAARCLPAKALTEELVKSINNRFLMGNERTPTQDPEFAVRQLVEVALRALSPGINDPFTAMNCIDWLSAALSRLSQREMPTMFYYDKNEQLRVIATPITFQGLVEAAFNQIRQIGRSNEAVTIRMMEALAVVIAQVHRPEDRKALGLQALMIWRGSQESLPEESDRADVAARYEELKKYFEAP